MDDIKVFLVSVSGGSTLQVQYIIRKSSDLTRSTSPLPVEEAPSETPNPDLDHTRTTLAAPCKPPSLLNRLANSLKYSLADEDWEAKACQQFFEAASALMRCGAPELTLTVYVQLRVGDGASGSGSVQLEFASAFRNNIGTKEEISDMLGSSSILYGADDSLATTFVNCKRIIQQSSAKAIYEVTWDGKPAIAKCWSHLESNVRGQVALQVVVKLSDDGGLPPFASSFASTTSDSYCCRASVRKTSVLKSILCLLATLSSRPRRALRPIAKKKNDEDDKPGKKRHRSPSQKKRSREWFQKKIEERKAASAAKKEIATWWSPSYKPGRKNANLAR
ncbi:uncharacterized protein NFIA_050010 [Aspergillus fischeri NRRL 181]|uniref:Uncharacterized protein n=1 Tax=Neosartorya fischeri (strain ATCC 1020 / DSM 3700 / CBS 544.65 / FGSC A1164 / JCM 1740 / NRRL 181 / WB 181) TaxID=331117 RepID=A1DLI8_NEOFI|nr:uncharacterized protein NFIA_050010 [Aspergillus fischeri NRRL 181]EAW15659.1 predicted protein [Aspergillus fischeri NRRL 181]